ncbi:MAG: terminase small subunit [Deltaproteobacteria bacterium]
MALTPQQELFVRQYVLDLNATKAALRAGYAKKYARQQGSYLLSKIDIQAAIKARLERRYEKVDIKTDDVLRLMRKFAFTDLSGVFEVRGGRCYITDTAHLSEDQMACISEIKQTAEGIQVKLISREKMVELLGRHMGMFMDKLEHSGGLKVTHTMTDEELERVAAGGE